MNVVWEPEVGKSNQVFYPYGKSILHRWAPLPTLKSFALLMSMPEIDVNAGHPLWEAINAKNVQAVQALLEHRELDLSRTCPEDADGAGDMKPMTALDLAMDELNSFSASNSFSRAREKIEAIVKMIQDEVDYRRLRASKGTREEMDHEE